MRLPALLALTVLPVTSLQASAQSSGRLPRVLDLPASTRAMALGDAYMMDAGQADGIFYHPALLARSDGFGLELQRWGAEGSATAASAAMQWLGGGVGIGLLALQSGSPGLGAITRTQDDLFDPGLEPASERVAVVGYAREVLGIDVGVAGKLVAARLGDSRGTEAMLDVSAATDLGPVTVGLTIHDIGDEPILGRDGIEPSRYVLGVGGYGQQLGILDVGASAAVGYGNDDFAFSGGVEVGYWPINGRTFVARIGVQEVPAQSGLSPMSFGFAFWGDDLVLEWAFRPYDGSESGTHRFGVRW